MKMLFLGDVMGRAGRRAITERLAGLRETQKLDFVVVNGENASSGHGLTGKHANAILAAGPIASHWAIMPLINVICWTSLNVNRASSAR